MLALGLGKLDKAMSSNPTIAQEPEKPEEVAGRWVSIYQSLHTFTQSLGILSEDSDQESLSNFLLGRFFNASQV